MTKLDPAIRELLAAVVDLDKRTRHAGPTERADALAFAGGVLRGVVNGDVQPGIGAVVLRAWTPTPRPGPPLLTRPHDWPTNRRER